MRLLRISGAAACAVLGASGAARAQGEGTDPRGACCIPCPQDSSKSDCLRLVSIDCASMGGSFAGSGTSCDIKDEGECACERDIEIRVPAVKGTLIRTNPSSTDQPVGPGGGGLCSMFACAPNPNKRSDFDVVVTELSLTPGPTLGGGGYGCIGFMLSGSPLTPRGAYGEGTLAGQPCANSDQAPVGIMWPFRDQSEAPPPGMPCRNANNQLEITMDSRICGFRAHISAEIHGGPLETLPGYPMGLDVYGRGQFDPFGNVIMASLRMTPLSGPQRPLLFTVAGGRTDLIDFPPPVGGGGGGGGGPVCVSRVPIARKSTIVIMPGFNADPLLQGAQINGLAARELGEYGFPPLVVQNTRTSAGDKSEPTPGSEGSEGSELDSLDARIITHDVDGRPIPPVVKLFVAGNLKSMGGGGGAAGLEAPPTDWDNLEIFIDSIDGQGQHTLLGNNSSVDQNALNRMGEKTASNGNNSPGPNGRGLTFEPGCDPDFYTNVSLRTTDGRDFDMLVHHAELPTAGAGAGWFVGSLDDSLFLTSDGLLTGGDPGAPAIRASMSNVNFEGVLAGTSVAPFQGPGSGLPVVTGVELSIPLSAIGNPTGMFKIVAFLTRKDHGFISNQVLPGIGGGGSLGEPRQLEFSQVGGSQCAAIFPPKNPLWKNGEFDRLNAQTSQVGVDQDWQSFGRITADDFCLCDGQIHAIDTITGTLTTNASVPKAQIVIWPDCNGRPDINNPIAVLSSAPQVFQGRPINAVEGDVFLRETGSAFDGFRIISVEGRFAKPVFLRGGAYWVSLIGFSGTANTADEFFWGTAGGESGSPIVKGRPGQFYDSEVGQWVDIDLLCCGCTDFNFCIGGESCKLLFDNASPALNLDAGEGLLATPSLQNGSNASTRSRSASDIVLPPCAESEICYIEGYVWTNCPRVALQFFEPGGLSRVPTGGCSCPIDGFAGTAPIEADCITDTGHRYQIPGTGITLKLLKAQFFKFAAPQFPLIAGRNLWVSLYALGDNTQNGRGYFALGDRCDRVCDVLFNGPCIRGPAFDTGRWAEATAPLNLYDHALAVAIRQVEAAAPAATNTCPADTNRNGELTVQDIFDYLAAWFAGCP